MKLVPLNMFKPPPPPPSIFTGASFVDSCSFIFVFRVCLCLTVLSVPCSPVITCSEKADPLALLFVMFSCVFVTFPYGVPGQVWYWIVWIPDLCLCPTP